MNQRDQIVFLLHERVELELVTTTRDLRNVLGINDDHLRTLLKLLRRDGAIKRGPDAPAQCVLGPRKVATWLPCVTIPELEDGDAVSWPRPDTSGIVAEALQARDDLSRAWCATHA